MANRIFVTGEDRIVKNENNLVDLVLADGREFAALEPRRLFPVSNLNSYITLLDGEGVEVAIIRSLSDLDPASLETVKYSLDDYYLVPVINSIISIDEKYGTLRWTVETDRGIKKFDIRNRNHDIKVFPDGRIRVRDSDDNRYIIRDLNSLDAHSRSRLIADL